MKREDIYLAFFFLAISAFLIIFLLIPKKEQINQLKSELKQKEFLLSTHQKYAQNLKEILERKKIYEEKIKIVEDTLPDYPSLPQFLEFLQVKSGETGLFFDSIEKIQEIKRKDIQELEGEKEQTLGQFELKLNFSGSYPSFKNFLSYLENSVRLPNIKNISLFLTEEKLAEEKKERLNISIDLVIFSFQK